MKWCVICNKLNKPRVKPFENKLCTKKCVALLLNIYVTSVVCIHVCPLAYTNFLLEF